MRNQESAADQAVKAGVAALATASKTPFTTSFKVMFGIGLAQIAVALTFLTGLAALITIATLVLR